MKSKCHWTRPSRSGGALSRHYDAMQRLDAGDGAANVRGAGPRVSAPPLRTEACPTMWPDNETRVDLLGFDFLVDELLELLLDPNVLPMTVGVAGDWGSGKSSILKMAAERLCEDHADNILVVEFSPWRFEDYADVKAALLADVLGKVRGGSRRSRTRIGARSSSKSSSGWLSA